MKKYSIEREEKVMKKVMTFFESSGSCSKRAAGGMLCYTGAGLYAGRAA